MKYYKYIVIFLSTLILLLGGYIIYVQSTITPLDNNDIKEENNKDSINNINKELDYDCSFTQTFRFYQKIDYETYVDGTAYVLGDIYQSYEPILLIVYEEDANKMEKYKYYEFTYTLKGTWSEITDYNTLNILVKASFDKEHSTSTNSATLKIKETDKVGLSQVSEPICNGK